ncbi:MAG: glycogen/starch synthase [Elusimicrobiota bacterium]
MNMKVLMATFECVPYAKVGGLADVSGTLPKFLRKQKVDVRIVIPLHKSIDVKKFRIKNLNKKFFIPSNNGLDICNIRSGESDGVPVYFLENNKYFNREEIYGTKEGDYPDNPERFIFFSRAVLEACKALDFKPDVIHSNDMQTALIPAYLKTLYCIDSFFSQTSTLYTIHNIAYQGLYPVDVFNLTGFSWNDFTPDKFEYYGKVNFMKAGIVYADAISTVSPTYAREIHSSNEYGRGLEGVLESRKSDLYGVLNGIDYVEWDPQKDKIIKSNYSIKNAKKITEAKEICKSDLRNELKLPDENVPLFGMVSRIDSIKGFDLLINILPRLVEMPVQIAILGLGKKSYVDKLTESSEKFPEKVKFNCGFNNELAHKIYAGSDFFLMPSKTEPCGLSQMLAMRYGTIPVVHYTGGLADTVEQIDITIKKGTGFLFREYSESALLNTIINSVEIYFKDRELLARIIHNAMRKNFSWINSSKQYLKIYRSAIKKQEQIWLQFIKTGGSGC